MAAIMWAFSQTTLIVTDVPAGSPWTRTERSPPQRSGAGNSKRPELRKNASFLTGFAEPKLE
jgi:hypothetical protein